MIPQEYIRKKQKNLNLNRDELRSFFTGYLNEDIPEYQMSAMLMASYFNPFNEQETQYLTQLMQNSGHVFNWPGVPPELIVDKHSTGGVGDKTSLIILPLCLLEGIFVPMISGRGLGHTGGTVDKLESIPGLRMQLSVEEAANQLRNLGGFFMSQTSQIAPLDRKLYALRDATSTVESIPLITSSILSKKLAEGLHSLVLDVKFGSGAFMKEYQDAFELAGFLKKVAKKCGLNTRCLLTSMNSPLGKTAGNLLEVRECIDILKGQGPKDVRTLSLELVVEMIQLARNDIDRSSIFRRLESHLDSGRAYEKFSEIIREQGGDLTLMDSKLNNKTQFQQAVISKHDGFVSSCDVRSLGMAVVSLGGGRKRVNDPLNFRTGLTHLKQVGDPVSKGEPLCLIEADQEDQLFEAEQWIRSAYRLGVDVERYELIKNVI